MGMHTCAIIAIDRLGHESDRFAILLRDIFDHIFVEQQVIGSLNQGTEAHIDFALARGSYLVVQRLDLNTEGL